MNGWARAKIEGVRFKCPVEIFWRLSLIKTENLGFLNSFLHEVVFGTKEFGCDLLSLIQCPVYVLSGPLEYELGH